MGIGYTSQGWVDDNGQPLETKTLEVSVSVEGKGTLTFKDEDGIKYLGRDEQGRPIVSAETVIFEPPKVEHPSVINRIFEAVRQFYGLGKER